MTRTSDVPPMDDVHSLLRILRRRLASDGFDLVSPLLLRRYNDAVQAPHRLPMPAGPDTLAFVVGNTRALWAPFLDALREDAELVSASDPIDCYVERSVAKVLAELALDAVPYFSHRLDSPIPAMQRAAECAGLARVGPAHLSVHPDHGPWIALRAILVTSRAAPLPAVVAPDLCRSCEKPCVPAFEYALRTTTSVEPGANDIADHWRDWAAIREACPVGRDSRYGDRQLRYHYTKARDALASTDEAADQTSTVFPKRKMKSSSSASS